MFDKVLVPVKLTDEMRERMAQIGDGPLRSHDEFWAEMLDAAFIAARPAFGDKLVIERRRIHTDQLVASILSIVGPFIGDESGKERNAMHDCSHALFEALYKAGATIVTDADRHEAGLPPRGDNGWTQQELAALEARHMELLTQPMSSQILPRS